MNLLYSGDSNACDGILISAMSVIKQTKMPVSIFILTAELTFDGKHFTPIGKAFAEALDGIVKAQNSESCVRLIDLSDRFSKELPRANMGTRFTPMCMLRLYADTVDGLPQKLVYLDADTICRGDISELWNVDTEGAELCGVSDRYGRWFFEGGIFGRGYLNSGVLILDMEMIRKTRLFERCRKTCLEKKMFMPDQSALNKLAVKKKRLKRRFNEQKRERDDTLIRHFTTTLHLFPKPHSRTVKPWDIERMHSVLKTYEYDALLSECAEIMKGIKK